MRKTIFLTGMLCLAGASSSLAARSTVPQVPDSDFAAKWWLGRFDEKRTLADAGDYPVVFLGDSITKGWETAGKEVWAANFAEGRYRALNCGFSGDRTEHVLWRLDHGQFGKLRPKAVVLMIGTNNTGHHPRTEETPIDTIAGVRAVVLKLRELYPETKVILHPILPRGKDVNDPNRLRDDIVNEKIACLADGKSVAWCDFNARLVSADGTLSTEMAKDLLHPGRRGYEIWAESVKPYLDWARDGAALPVPAAPMATALEPQTNAAPVNISAGYGWFDDGRYQRKRTEIMDNESRWFDLVMLGDSITHGWEGEGREVWQRRFLGYRVLDIGFSGDRVQNQLWNAAYGGLLDGYRTGLMMLLVGTNNAKDSAEDTAEGIRKLIGVMRRKQPAAKILLVAIFPRGREPNTEIRVRNTKVNEIIRGFADGETVLWVDFTDRLVDADGRVPKDILYDFTHPTAKGYAIWADAILPYLEKHARR